MDIKALLAMLGGPAAVGRMCGITSQAVSQWRQVPVAQAITIEQATNGQVSRSDLRPDIWPPEGRKHAA